MIQILARHVIKPACLEAYHTLAAELVEKSRAEAGCVSYASVQSKDDPRVHVFVECWKDQAAIDAHNASEHFTRIIPQFTELFDEADQVTLYDVLY